MNTISALRELRDGHQLVTFSGAGGKSSAIHRIAHDLRDIGKRVLITTTTKIMRPVSGTYDLLHLGSRLIELHIPRSPFVVVAASAVDQDGKMSGYEASYLDRVFEAQLFDVILAEADGARSKPIKAPAEYEPVIPKAVTVAIGVTGCDSFNVKANDKIVHRLELFRALTGIETDGMIDGVVLAKLVNKPKGLFKNAPADALRVWIVNKVDNASTLETSKEIATFVVDKSPNLDRIILARFEHRKAEMVVREIIKNSRERAHV